MTPYTRRHRLFHIALLYSVAALLVGYFAFNTWSGAHGLKAKKQYEQEIAALQSDLARVKGERERLSQRISLLNPDTIDPDMLEERAREVLHYVHPQEVIIFRK